MTLDRAALRWNGWGRLDVSAGLTPAREAFLLEQLAERFQRVPQRCVTSVALGAVSVPEPVLDEEVVKRLREACGPDAVAVDVESRVLHAAGRSLPDLFRLRQGQLERAPDAVVWPADEESVRAVLRIAASAAVAVVPYGGGTSVVGGVDPKVGPGQRGVIALDTTRMDATVRIDADAGLATFQAGIDGPSLEAELAARALTLGHFPQSFEFSTLGGWIAARSSGQQSNGYGSIDALLVALKLVTPEGDVRTIEVPRSAAGPDLNAMVLGSEGTLGVIVEATLRVSPKPTHHDDRAMVFHSFADGVAAAKQMVRERVGLGLLRLSDARETELAQVQRHDPERHFDAVPWVFAGLERLGYGEGRAVLLYGAEGTDEPSVTAAVDRARAIGRIHRGAALGRSAGRSWRRDRFHTPYLRDWLLDRGVAVDTFETAFSWNRLETGHAHVVAALEAATREHAGGGIAMAHLSHSYLDGACLYFTVLYPLGVGEPIEQWRAIKREVTDAIVAAGGTLSHHHGVGSDHTPWLAEEKGALGMRALEAVKHSVDPHGIMNPGKLW